MRRGVIIGAVLGTLFAAAPAIAQTTETIEITVGGVNRFPEGEVREITSVDVPEGLIGATCSGTATTQNNASEHPNNDFILASGATTAAILDWEREAGATTSMTGTLTLGTTISVSLRMGAAGVSSGGVAIVLSCAQPEPPPEETTTTVTQPPEPPEETTTTVTQPPEPPEETTTTEPPPTGGIEAGGGSTAGGASPAAPWVGVGALLLAGALALVALGRQIASKRD